MVIFKWKWSEMLLPKLKTNRKRIVIELWDHIVFLIQDAFILYRNEKYSSSCFMAFTAFEEIGKLNKFILSGKRRDDGVRLHNFTKYKKEWLHYQTEYRNLKM